MKFSFKIVGQPFGKLNMKPVFVKNHASLVNPKPNITYMDHVINSVLQAVDTGNEAYMIDTPIFEKDVPLIVTIKAYFKLQSNCYGKKGINKNGRDKLERKILPTLKPDCDNISKIVCDGINHAGVIWFDDSQIVMLVVSKEYAEIPRVEVVIENYPTISE